MSWGIVLMQLPVDASHSSELHHEDDGGLLGSTPYWQFGLVVHTHDAQHTRNKKKQYHLHICSEPIMLFWASGKLLLPL
jgi:hypothetical protein